MARTKTELSAYSRRWNLANPERAHANQLAWYHRHGDANRAAQRRKYARNKEAYRAYSLLARYGVTADEVSAILFLQGGRCATCTAAEPGGKGAWHVDHKHVDDWAELSHEQRRRSVRGLPCHRCNTALGLIRENAATLLAMDAYLAKHEGHAV